MSARRPVAMIVHAYYEEDPRVRREAEAVVASGRPVDVFALRQPGDPADVVIDGVRVHRLDVQRHQGAGIGRYLLEYVEFFLRAMFALTQAHRGRRYALVQVHSIPDALVFATLPLRLAGVPVVLDLHEAMPEFFRMRFPKASGAIAHAALVAQEKASIAFSTATITVNRALGDRLVAMGVHAGKVTIIRNSPSLARFDASAHPVRPFMADGALRLVYAGALSTVYELDVALQAVARIAAERPDLPVSLELYGRDFAEVPLREHASALGITDRIVFHGRVPIEAVPGVIAAADIGLAPTRRTEFTDFSLSTKIFEYAAMGKPVVASRLPMVEAMFPPGTVTTYAAGDAEDLARAIFALVDDGADREARVAATSAIVREVAWERESIRYLDLVERLARDGISSPAAGDARPPADTEAP
ncbi:MAG: glycosyltransferase [Chloroflexota bacterium]|nr:glycosyltransferase [Chloroflexota bacterium]